jgi:hypothetical protein
MQVGRSSLISQNSPVDNSLIVGKIPLVLLIYKDSMKNAAEEMIEPPTRQEMAADEKLARRILTRSKDQDIRVLCKNFIKWVSQVDRYADSIYPCFSMMETEVRQHGASFSLENDGVWRLRSSKGKIVVTGTSLKDLFVNLILWQGEWPEEEFLEDCASEEDEIFEPDRRKNPKNRTNGDV